MILRKSSKDVNTLLQIFGPNTSASIDYYNATIKEQYEAGEPLHGELFMKHVLREGINY